MVWKARVLAVVIGADHLLEAFCRLLLLLTGFGLLSLLTLVVVMRYAFASGLTIATELTELMFAIFVMAGIVQAARMGVHVATQIALSLLQGRWRLALSIIIHTVTAAAYLLLAWYALQNAIVAHDQVTPVLGIPWSVGYGCLTLGLLLIAVCSLLTVLRQVLASEAPQVAVGNPGAAAS